MSSTRLFIEINFVLYSSFSYFLSMNKSSPDMGQTLVRLNAWFEGCLAITLRLLFFLMALNLSVPLDVLSLFRQYLLNQWLLLEELVGSLCFLLSMVCFTYYKSMGCCRFKRELLQFRWRTFRFFIPNALAEFFMERGPTWAVWQRLVIYKLIPVYHKFNITLKYPHSILFLHICYAMIHVSQTIRIGEFGIQYYGRAEVTTCLHWREAFTCCRTTLSDLLLHSHNLDPPQSHRLGRLIDSIRNKYIWSCRYRSEQFFLIRRDEAHFQSQLHWRGKQLHRVYMRCIYLMIGIPFFSSWISSQSMFPSEFRGDGSLLVRIMNSPLGLEGIEERAEEHGVIKLWREPLVQNSCTLLQTESRTSVKVKCQVLSLELQSLRISGPQVLYMYSGLQQFLFKNFYTG